MKRITLMAIIAAALPLAQCGVFAGPLDASTVGSEAKWLLHFDVDEFRKTAIGKFVVKSIVEPKLAEAQENGLPFDLPLNEIHSVTAYGPDFEDEPDTTGVLLLNVGQEIRKAVTGLLVQQSAVPSEGDQTAPVKLVGSEGSGLYHVNGEFYVSNPDSGAILLSKNKEQIDRARAVLDGKVESMKGANTLADYGSASSAFFFLGAAEGFGKNGALPPQAQVLKQAEGLKVLLGETDEQLTLNLTLSTKTKEASTQIRQVVEGLLALVSLSQSNANPDLAELARSAKVAEEGMSVRLGAKFPVKFVIDHIKSGRIYIKKEEEKHEDHAEDETTSGT